jgi:hypothetical protein
MSVQIASTSGTISFGVSTSVTFAMTVSGTNKAMTIQIGTRNDYVGATYNGDAFTTKVAISNNTSGAGIQTAIALLLNPDDGTHNCVVSRGGTTSPAHCCATLLVNVDQVTGVRDTDFLAATTNAPSLTLTSVSGDMAFDVLTRYAGADQYPANGQTVNLDGGSALNSRLAKGGYLECSGVSTTVGWTQASAGVEAYVAVIIKQTSATGGILLGTGVCGGMESGIKSVGMLGGLRG